VKIPRDTFDPDVDLLPYPETVPPGEPLGDYQRLILNPLPALLLWATAGVLIHGAVGRRSLLQFFNGIALLFVAPLFMQFYCPDCRASGWIIRYRRHACQRVVNRWKARSELSWPMLKIQLAIWFGVLAAASILGMVVVRTWH
jgi:hypothetical protein